MEAGLPALLDRYRNFIKGSGREVDRECFWQPDNRIHPSDQLSVSERRTPLRGRQKD